MNTKLTVEFPGLSLLEVWDKYQYLMYPQTWFNDEAFAKEKAPAGIYELRIPATSFDKTYDEQMKLAAEDEDLVHPAVLLYGILSHFESNGERVLKNSWARTSGRDSVGSLVYLGYFDSEGANVRRDWPGIRRGALGACFSRMVNEGMSNEKVNSDEAMSLGARLSRVEAVIKHHNLST